MSAETTSIPKSQRLVSLALFLGGRTTPATKGQIAEEIEGYAKLASGNEAVQKQFARDIKSLQDLGLPVRAEKESYLIDTAASRRHLVSLDSADALRLRLMCLAPLNDPTFIYGNELRSAFTKLAGILEDASPQQSTISTLPPAPNVQTPKPHTRDLIKQIEDFCAKRKEIAFSYTNASGVSKPHTVQPHGVFSVESEWYFIGMDLDVEQKRQFRVSRTQDLKQRNKKDTPDFDPVDFDAQDWMQYPFSFGNEDPFCVVFLLTGRLKSSLGKRWQHTSIYTIEDDPQHLLMVATARNTTEAARWAVEYGSGTVPIYPQKVVDAFFAGLKRAGDVS